MRLWESIPPKNPNPFMPFLAKIVRNLALNRYKAEHTQKKFAGEFAVSLDELDECIVSMLDDKFVEEAQKPFAKRKTAPTAIKICFAAAACAAAVCAFVLFPRGKAADILVFGENPSASPVAVRSYDNEGNVILGFAIEHLDIPISVTSSEKSVVRISGGSLHFDGDKENALGADEPFELNGNASLVWTVPLNDKTAEFTLTAQTGNHSRVLTLSFDKSENKWTVREKSAN